MLDRSTNSPTIRRIVSEEARERELLKGAAPKCRADRRAAGPITPILTNGGCAMTTLSGVWLPIVTPFHGGAVDFVSYEKLIEHSLAAGISGIFPLGTTGESPTLDDEESEALIECTLGIVGGIAADADKDRHAPGASLSSSSRVGLSPVVPSGKMPLMVRSISSAMRS